MKEGERIVSAIQNADKVLIGIGKEFEVNTQDFNKKQNKIMVDFPSWCRGYEELWALKNGAGDLQKEAYNKLKELVHGKDYFIISLNMDDLIRDVFPDDAPIVTPCGTMQYLQCEKACTPKLIPAKESVDRILNELSKGMDCDPNQLSGIQPRCPLCKEPLEFNNLYAKQYVEEGYLEQWEQYKKWLQTTINRNLCIVELGVGMAYPSIVRFAFDKLMYYNQKAKFFRVHETLYQHTSENGERGVSIKKNALEFVLQDF